MRHFIILFLFVFVEFVSGWNGKEESEEIVEVYVSGTYHWKKMKLICGTPNFSWMKISDSEYCVQNLNKDGDICDSKHCPVCLGGFCLSSVDESKNYLFRIRYYNYSSKVNRRRYLKKIPKEHIKDELKINNIS